MPYEKLHFQAQLLQAVGQAIIAIDLKGNVTFWNHAAEWMYGWSEAEAMGQPLIELILPSTGVEQANEIMAMLAKGENWTGEFTVQRRDGTRFPVLVTDTPIYNSEGELTGYVGVSVDISEQKHTEQALRESEERFRAIAEIVPTQITVVDDVESKMLYANEAARQAAGIPDDVLLGTPMLPFLAHPQDNEGIGQALQEYGRVQNQELAYLDREGHERWVLFSAQAISFDGKPATICATQDITERKRDEQALRESEERFRVIADMVPVEITVTDAMEYKILYSNGAALRNVEIADGELLGTPILAFLTHPEDVEKILPTLQQQGFIHNEELAYRDVDGIERWALFSSHVIFFEGKPAIISASQDITERKHAEQALRESEERFRLIAEMVPTWITVADINTERIIYANETAQHELGGADGQLIGRHVNDFWLKPQDRVQLRQAIDAHGVVKNQEVMLIDSRGHEHACLISARPIRFAGTLGLVAISHDITERKEFKEAQRQAEALQQALDTEKQHNELRLKFMSMVSHEFRTPLAIIQSATDLVDRYGDRLTPERKQAQFAEIHTQVRELTELLDDFLTVSKLETASAAFQPEPIDLQELLQTLVGRMRHYGSNHVIQLACKGQSRLLLLDRKLIQQAITNLLSNAIKYSPRGGSVGIDLHWKPDEVVVRISDQGIGIPEADQKRLFELFHRASNIGTIQGTGLGLAIVKRAVEAHHGTIAVDSALDRGTTFTLCLPAAKISE